MGDFAQYGHPEVQNTLAPVDMIIVQRNMLEQAVWDACDYWRALGKVVVGDLDDDYPHLTPQNPAHEFWLGTKSQEFKKRRGVTPIEALGEGLKHTDGLCSPNRLILADWEERTGVPGYVLFNYADETFYGEVEQKPPPADGEPVVVGWGGSVSHYDSWWFSGLKDAALELFDRFPALVFKICGNDFRLLRELGRAWPADRWVHQKGVPPQEWPGVVATFDVGVAPLCGPGAPQSESYDNHRSDIKAQEYVLCGVPWVASPGPVYERLDGKGGFRVGTNTSIDWVATISDVIRHLDQRKAASRGLMAWGMEELTMARGVKDYDKLHTLVKSEAQAREGRKLPGVIYVQEMIDGATFEEAAQGLPRRAQAG